MSLNRQTPWGGPCISAAPQSAPCVLVPPAPATPAAPVTVAAPAAPVCAVIPACPAAPAAPGRTVIGVATPTACRPVSKPTFARQAGQHWSDKEGELVRESFRIAGLAAAYRAVPHRTTAAVRGFLQRAGLIPPTPKKPSFTP